MKDNWIAGIPYEVAFWRNVYRWPHTYKGMMAWSHHGGAIALEGFDAGAWLRNIQAPRVLDVGCGMSYATGNHLLKDGQLIPLEIHYIDPLAPFFNEIRSRYRPGLPEIEFGMVEYLSSFYHESAHLIIIQNALDHAANPVKGIVEALGALRQGGVLYLNHHPNEAEKEHYKGFHQFNIIIEEGRLVVWNKQERHDISRLLDGFATVETSQMANGHVIAVIRKTAAVPASMLHLNADRQELSRQLLQLAFRDFHFARHFGTTLRFWAYNIVQFCIQGLPWKMKMGLKKLIHQY